MDGHHESGHDDCSGMEVKQSVSCVDEQRKKSGAPDFSDAPPFNFEEA